MKTIKIRKKAPLTEIVIVAGQLFMLLVLFTFSAIIIVSYGIQIWVLLSVVSLSFLPGAYIGALFPKTTLRIYQWFIDTLTFK